MNNTITRKSFAKSIAALAIAAMVLPTGCSRELPRAAWPPQDQEHSYQTGFGVGWYINKSAAQASDASVTCNLLAKSRDPKTDQGRYVSGCVDALQQRGAK